jgi:integrase
MLTCPWNTHGPPERGEFDRASDYWADQDLPNENHHSPTALVADLARLETDGLVFANRAAGYLRYGNWRRDCWNPAVKRSGVKARPHDLRATCASLLIDAGASVKDVQHHLGHQDELTTLRLYSRVRPERSADLAKRDALTVEMDERGPLPD